MYTQEWNSNNVNDPTCFCDFSGSTNTFMQLDEDIREADKKPDFAITGYFEDYKESKLI